MNHIDSQKGFTLIELLVVISIIGMLSSVVLASLNSARGKARDSQRIQALTQMRTALELYAGDNGGHYPMSRDSIGDDITYFIGTTPGCSLYGIGVQPIYGLAPTYIPYLPQDPKSPNVSAYCYVYASDGDDYKFMVFETAEFNTQTPVQHTLADPHVNGSGARDRTRSLSVYSPNASTW